MTGMFMFFFVSQPLVESRHSIFLRTIYEFRMNKILRDTRTFASRTTVLIFFSTFK